MHVAGPYARSSVAGKKLLGVRMAIGAIRMGRHYELCPASTTVWPCLFIDGLARGDRNIRVRGSHRGNVVLGATSGRTAHGSHRGDHQPYGEPSVMVIGGSATETVHTECQYRCQGMNGTAPAVRRRPAAMGTSGGWRAKVSCGITHCVPCIWSAASRCVRLWSITSSLIAVRSHYSGTAATGSRYVQSAIRAISSARRAVWSAVATTADCRWMQNIIGARDGGGEIFPSYPPGPVSAVFCVGPQNRVGRGHGW